MSGLRYASHHVVLEPSRWQVRVGRDVVTPEPKVFELLSYLMRHSGRVVSKAELLDSLWGGDVVGESVLTRCVSCARKLLADDSKSPRFIRTVHGRGYEFIAPVSTLAQADGAPPIDVVEPRATSTAPTEAAPGAAPLVGRRAETARINAALQRLEGRHGDFVLISGEPGIGKTRLLEEARSLAPHAVDVHFARATAVQGAPPFYVWLQLFRSIVRSRSLKVALRAFEDAPSGARKLLFGTERAGGEQQLGWDSPSERFRTFDAIARGLTELGAHRPLALLFDDLQAADLASLLLLEFVAQAPGLPHLLLGTLRDTERPHDVARAEALARLRSSCKNELPLSGLNREEVELFVGQRVRHAPLGWSEQVLSRTAGNPFFLSVLTASAESNRHQESSLPTAVHSAVAQRLATLGEDCLRLLRTAAVFGPNFEGPLLAHAAAEPLDRCVASLGDACDARILARASSGEYRFVHDLIREVLYEQTPLNDRPRLHLSVGKTLQALPTFRDARSAAVLAHHFTQAAHAGGAVDALDLSIRAGAYALRNFAYEEAIELFGSALRLLPLAGETDPATELAVLLDLGLSQISAGQREAGQDTLRGAAERAREQGSASELASVALNLAPGLFAIETGVYDPTLVGLLREALAQAGEDEPKRRALLLARLALALYWSDTFDERARLCDEARALAQALGTDDVLAAVETANIFALLRPDNLAERSLQSERALELCQRSGDHHGLLMNRLLRAAMFLESGDTAAVKFEIEAFKRLAEASRAPQALWIVQAQQACQLLLDGRLAQVEQLAGACLFAGQRVHDHNALLTFGIHLTLVRIEQARAGEVLDVVRDYAARYPRIRGWRVLYAYVLYRAGRMADCGSEYESLKRSGFTLAKDLNWMVTMSWLAETCHALEDADGARLVYERLQPYADRLVVAGYAGIACCGSMERYLGLLAASFGDPAAARQHFERAIEINRRVSATLPLLQALADYATWLKQIGDHESAQRLAHEAAPLIAERELTSLAAQLASATAELG